MKDYVFLILILLLALAPPIFSKIIESLKVNYVRPDLIDYKLYDQGAVNSIRFNEFLLEICKNVKNKLFILDNGQIHKKEETKKIIKDSGNFLLYTLFIFIIITFPNCNYIKSCIFKYIFSFNCFIV